MGTWIRSQFDQVDYKLENHRRKVVQRNDVEHSKIGVNLRLCNISSPESGISVSTHDAEV